jgi:hypothetical protein
MMRVFIVLFSLVGLVVPALFTALSQLLTGIYRPDSHVWRFDIVQLLLWPSSIFMLATAGHEGIDYEMLAISIVANVALYALLGFLVWWGVYKQRWVLYVVAGVIALGWYKLLVG